MLFAVGCFIMKLEKAYMINYNSKKNPLESSILGRVNHNIIHGGKTECTEFGGSDSSHMR